MRRLYLAAVSFILSGCVTPANEPMSAPENLVKNATVLPASFALEVTDPFPRLIIPGELLHLGVVNRQRAEVRTGPDLHFSVQDQLLTRGDKVIEFQRVGVWSRIVSVTSGQLGWVHHQALARDHHAPRQVELAIELLPAVFTRVENARVFDYPSQRPLQAKIPQGRMMRLLLQGRTMAVVWIAETNAVVWMHQEDFE